MIVKNSSIQEYVDLANLLPKQILKSHDGMYNFILCLGQNLYSHMILKVNHFHLLPFKVKMWLTGFILHNPKDILRLPLYAVLYIPYKNALETFLYKYIFSFFKFLKKEIYYWYNIFVIYNYR